MQKNNYQHMLDNTIDQIISDKSAPTLLLHCCCAPCSSYIFEYISRYFHITAYFYNPNISPEQEYTHRVDELQRLIDTQPHENDISLFSCEYDSNIFYETVKGLENEPEGGARCMKCYRLRLEQSAKYAAEHGFDYFTTTLSISPHKNAQALNEIGRQLAEKYNIKYLFSDFKKKNGYKRSIELSHQYELYRQNYCGCVFSKAAADDAVNNAAENDKQ